MRCILIYLLSIYILNIHGILRTPCTKNYVGWAIYIGPAVKKRRRIVTKRTSVASCNKTPSAQLQGCHQEGGGFLPRRRAFLHPTSFYRTGVFIIFPRRVFCYLQGWGRRAKLSAGPQATAPYLHTIPKIVAVKAKTLPSFQGWASSHRRLKKPTR